MHGMRAGRQRFFFQARRNELKKWQEEEEKFAKLNRFMPTHMSIHMSTHMPNCAELACHVHARAHGDMHACAHAPTYTRTQVRARKCLLSNPAE